MKIKLIEHFTWFGNRLTEGVTGRQGICLLPLGTWSHLWYIKRSVFSLFSDLYFLQDFMRSMTVRNVCHCIQVNWVSKYCEVNILQSKQLCHLLEGGFWTLLGVGAKVVVTPNAACFASTCLYMYNGLQWLLGGQLFKLKRRFVRRLWIDGNINPGCVYYCTIEKLRIYCSIAVAVYMYIVPS
jgi:hypothetical protein